MESESRAIEKLHCLQCGRQLMPGVPAEDIRRRLICPACGYIHYTNPKVVCTALLEVPERQGILLLRRATEPRSGFWSAPGGFMESGESLATAAAREAREEVGVKALDLKLFSVHSLSFIDQLYVAFRGRIKSAAEVVPGVEATEARFFAEDEIPWEQLAFPVVAESLRLFHADRRRGHFGIHHGEVVADGKPGDFCAVSVVSESPED